MIIDTIKVRSCGLDFRCLSAGEGPLLLCLHGFPDTSRTFHHQIEHFAHRGFRVVAPCMRGYNVESIPADGCYQTAALGMDALGLIDALGYQTAAIVGHDWGALAGYAAAIAAPERVTRLIAISVGYGGGAAFLTNRAQQKRSWYMFFFQMPFAEKAVEHGDFAFIEDLWKDWSPGAELSEISAVKEAFRVPGVLCAALSYYRQVFGDSAHSKPELAELQKQIGTARVAVPTLYIHGARDGCMGPELSTDMGKFFTAQFRRVLLTDAGHFVHLERPDEVNRLIESFLSERL